MHELLRLAFQQPANRNTSPLAHQDRKSTRPNSSHSQISYAVFCLKKKNHLAHRLERAPDVGADEVVGALEFGGPALAVIWQRPTQRSYAESREDPTQRHACVGLRV